MAKKTWVLSVDEEGLISFPEDLMNVMGWNEGTALEWQVEPDGSIMLKSADYPDDDLDKNEQPT
jgi:bifunctional DNA-binding transcriptional regulator/antitoxin component of YhaV-PrlF toxin-antitoxin module